LTAIAAQLVRICWQAANTALLIQIKRLSILLAHNVHVQSGDVSGNMVFPDWHL